MIAMFRALQQSGAGRWSARQVHDTVAAIVQQPEFATPLRQSLAGRIFRFLAERVAEVIRILRSSPGARVAAIAAVVIIVGVVVARIVVARRVDATRRFPEDHHGGRRGSRRDPWLEAQNRAAAGDFEAATHWLYGAVIESLGRSGSITLHSSKTSGDYARELARRGVPSSREFRAFARVADRVIFGTLRPDAQDYARMKSAAERIPGVPIAA
jgi:hypothetical protein